VGDAQARHSLGREYNRGRLIHLAKQRQLYEKD
jgi:hypothetical protein